MRGFDHVALPMQNTDATPAFYRWPGFDVTENATACSVYIGDQMINFHRPATWQREIVDFVYLRVAARRRRYLCFVWTALRKP